MRIVTLCFWVAFAMLTSDASAKDCSTEAHVDSGFALGLDSVLLAGVSDARHCAAILESMSHVFEAVAFNSLTNECCAAFTGSGYVIVHKEDSTVFTIKADDLPTSAAPPRPTTTKTPATRTTTRTTTRPIDKTTSRPATTTTEHHTTTTAHELPPTTTEFTTRPLYFQDSTTVDGVTIVASCSHVTVDHIEAEQYCAQRGGHLGQLNTESLTAAAYNMVYTASLIDDSSEAYLVGAQLDSASDEYMWTQINRPATVSCPPPAISYNQLVVLLPWSQQFHCSGSESFSCLICTNQE